MADKSPYEVLGVAPDASADEIRKAYKKLARKHHPDVNPGDAKSEQRFKDIASAYEVVSDADKRKNYDEFGEESLKSGFDPEKARAYRQWSHGRQQAGAPFRDEVVDFDIEDLLRGFGGFSGGGGFRGRQHGPMKGSDIHATVELELAQVFTGIEVSVAVPIGPDGKTQKVSVRIPPGAGDGSTLRIAGKGAPSASGGARGDLIIETRMRPHPRVTRDGLDLTMVIPVTLSEAYNGAEIEIPTFEGSVKLRVPPRSQPGTKLRLKGRGIPRGKDKAKKGNLYVVLDVRLPDGDDDALADALRAAEAAYTQPIREEIRL